MSENIMEKIESYKESVRRYLEEDLQRNQKEKDEADQERESLESIIDINDRDDNVLYQRNLERLKNANTNIANTKRAAKYSIEQLIALLKERNQELATNYMSKKPGQIQLEINRLETENQRLEFEITHKSQVIDQTQQLISKYAEMGDYDRKAELESKVSGLRTEITELRSQQKTNNDKINTCKNYEEEYKENTELIKSCRDKAKQYGIELEEKQQQPKTGETPETKTEAAPETKTEAAPETKTGEAPETKTGAAPEAKTGAAPETKTGAAPEAKTGAAPEAKTGAAPEAKTGAAPEAKTGAAPETKTGAAPETKTGAAPEAKTGEAPAPKTEESPEQKAVVPLHKIRIEISKDGSQSMITRRKEGYAAVSEKPVFGEKTKLSDRKDLEKMEKIAPAADKFVMREIRNMALKGILTRTEAMEQMRLYRQILKSDDENEIKQIKDKMKITLNYNLKGLRKAGISREERKTLIAHAKKARDLGIGEVTAGKFTEMKWWWQDTVKNSKFLSGIANRLPKGKQQKAMPAPKTEQQSQKAKKPAELDPETKKKVQEEQQRTGERAREESNKGAAVDPKMSESIDKAIEEEEIG